MKKKITPVSRSLPSGRKALEFLGREIAKNLTTLGQITTRPFRRTKNAKKPVDFGPRPYLLVDTSVLIDGRILSIVNSGFVSGTLLIPQFILGEVQHIADSSDSLRRTKGRRGLEIVGRLRGQKVNPFLKVKIVGEDTDEAKEADHKLIFFAKKWTGCIVTVDFNLSQLARAQGVKVLNVNDLANAMKVALVPGEELTIKITHEGRERAQGVGYLTDGTMVVVDNAKDKVGLDVGVIVTKVHQTPAGQLFFARLK